ncbi:hypothetical protein BJ742DRAFT_765682 [Cladochytrium replicatum]|nr:hypothetical protein BJ742DRAFT_765682 [Cladochytrium replicatum]
MDEVTGITVSLVKEFLSSSKAFSTTLNAFNSESTKYQPLISKRSDLAKALKITKLVKENSSRDNPRSSFLEVIVHYLMSKSSSSTTPKSSAPTPKSVTPTRNQPTKQPEVNQVQPMIPPDQTTSQSRNILSNSHLLTSVLPPRASSKGVPDSDGSTDNPHRSQMTTRPMDKSGSEGGWASAANDSRSSGKGRTPKIEDIEVLDHFSDEEEEETLSRGINLIRSMRDETNSSIPPALTTRGKPIELDVQYALRSLVLPETPGSKGSNRSMGFPDEWKGKGFVFRQSADDLAYGLVQSKGGPCGLLAVVQAYVIKHLILGAGGSASAVV